MIENFEITCKQPVNDNSVSIFCDIENGANYYIFARGFFEEQEHTNFIQIAPMTVSPFVIVGCAANKELSIYVKRIEGINETISSFLNVRTAPLPPMVLLGKKTATIFALPSSEQFLAGAPSVPAVYYEKANLEIICPGANCILIYDQHGNVVKVLNETDRSLKKDAVEGLFLCELKGLTSDTEFTYSAQATSSTTSIENISRMSEMVNFKTFKKPMPVNPIIVAITNTSCIARWRLLDDYHYAILLNGEIVKIVEDNGVVLQDLTPNTFYTLQVNIMGEGGEIVSETIEFTTKISAPQTITILNVGSGFIEIEVEKNIGATSYNYYLDDKLAGNSKVEKISFIGLNAGQQYRLGVTAVKDQKETVAAFKMVTTRVCPPVTVDAINILWDKLTLSWSKVGNAQSYNIFLVDAQNGYTFLSNENVTSYIVTALAPVNTYSFVVTSLLDTMESDYSDLVTFVTTPPIPSSPSNLRLEQRNKSSLIISWDPVYGYEKELQYNVYLAGKLHSVTSETTLTLLGLESSKLYLFNITAFNVAGESKLSSSLYVETLYALNTPGDVSVEVMDAYTVNVTWGNIADASRYEVFFNEEILLSDDNSYTKKDCKPFTHYTVKVRACNDTEVSDFSLPITISMPIGRPDAPKKLIAMPTSYGFTLQWNTVIDAYAYQITVDGEQFKTQNNEVYISNKKSNTTYIVTVSSVAIRGISSPAFVTVKTNEAAPQNLRSIQKTTTSLMITWDLVDQAEAYRLVMVNTENKEKQIPITGINAGYVTDLTSDTVYNFAVYSVDKEGVLSSASELLTVATVQDIPVAPCKVNYCLIDETSFQIYWKNIGNATSYNVYIDDILYSSVSYPIDFLNIGGMVAGETYTIEVTAIGVDGASERSEAVIVVTDVSQPHNLEIEKEDNDAMPTAIISWDKVENASEFKLYYKLAKNDDYVGTGLSIERSGYEQPSPAHITSELYYLIEPEKTRQAVRIYNFIPNKPYWMGISAINNSGEESAIAELHDNFTFFQNNKEDDEPLAVKIIFNPLAKITTIKWTT